MASYEPSRRERYDAVQAYGERKVGNNEPTRPASTAQTQEGLRNSKNDLHRLFGSKGD